MLVSLVQFQKKVRKPLIKCWGAWKVFKKESGFLSGNLDMDFSVLRVLKANEIPFGSSSNLLLHIFRDAVNRMKRDSKSRREFLSICVFCEVAVKARESAIDSVIPRREPNSPPQKCVLAAVRLRGRNGSSPASAEAVKPKGNYKSAETSAAAADSRTDIAKHRAGRPPSPWACRSRSASA